MTPSIDSKPDQTAIAAVDFLAASMALRRAPILSRLAAAASAGPSYHPATAAAAYNFLAAAAAADKSLCSLYGGLLRMQPCGPGGPGHAVAAAAAGFSPNAPAMSHRPGFQSTVTPPVIRPPMTVFSPAAAAALYASTQVASAGTTGQHLLHHQQQQLQQQQQSTGDKTDMISGRSMAAGSPDDLRTGNGSQSSVQQRQSTSSASFQGQQAHRFRPFGILSSTVGAENTGLAM